MCGDPYGEPHPENEAGGTYAKGIIVRQYVPGKFQLVESSYFGSIVPVPRLASLNKYV